MPYKVPLLEFMSVHSEKLTGRINLLTNVTAVYKFHWRQSDLQTKERAERSAEQPKMSKS